MPVCTHCGRSGHALADCQRRKADREKELKEERDHLKKEKWREEELQKVKDRGKRARASADEDEDEIVDDDYEDDDLEERKARARQRAEDEVAVELEAKKARQKALRKAKRREERAAEERRQLRADRKRDELLAVAVTRADIEAAYRAGSDQDNEWIATEVEEAVFERLSSSEPPDVLFSFKHLQELNKGPKPPHEIEASLNAVIGRAQVLYPGASEAQIIAVADRWKRRMLATYHTEMKEKAEAEEEERNREERRQLRAAAAARTKIVVAAVAVAALMVAAALYYSFG